ncbi:MAG TPA: aspartate-semialdehyde dehydrogenase [Allosphingosinicella sp.]|nr:aspartate-semialdehyde dehydrogenase [Allosphingosinicella sp.]
MLSRLGFTLVAGASVLLGCSGQAEPAPDNGASAPPPAATASPGAGNAAAEAPAPVALPAADAPILAGDGIEPDIAFGMARADAVAAATAAFGAPTGTQRNDECGEGPMEFVNFGALSLSFQDGRLAGWSLGEGEPALRTAGGIAVGTPRSALGGSEVDETSTLGPEFDIGGVGGVLDEEGRRVVALWAGLVCQFR